MCSSFRFCIWVVHDSPARVELGCLCAGMGLRHPKQLPSYQQPAPAAYPAAAGALPCCILPAWHTPHLSQHNDDSLPRVPVFVTGAAPAKPRRGLFGRRQAVPSTATAPTPTQEYTAQPFDQAHPGRDVEMGAQPGTGMTYIDSCSACMCQGPPVPASC